MIFFWIHFDRKQSDQVFNRYKNCRNSCYWEQTCDISIGLGFFNMRLTVFFIRKAFLVFFLGAPKQNHAIHESYQWSGKKREATKIINLFLFKDKLYPSSEWKMKTLTWSRVLTCMPNYGDGNGSLLPEFIQIISPCRGCQSTSADLFQLNNSQISLFTLFLVHMACFSHTTGPDTPLF